MSEPRDEPAEALFLTVDVVLAHHRDAFFREIAIYRLGKNMSKQRQTWVYGFMAKDGPAGPLPDEKRRRWVPLCVIKKG